MCGLWSLEWAANVEDDKVANRCRERFFFVNVIVERRGEGRTEWDGLKGINETL
jgi:hypothetical protein